MARSFFARDRIRWQQSQGRATAVCVGSPGAAQRATGVLGRVWDAAPVGDALPGLRLSALERRQFVCELAIKRGGVPESGRVGRGGPAGG